MPSATRWELLFFYYPLPIIWYFCFIHLAFVSCISAVDVLLFWLVRE